MDEKQIDNYLSDNFACTIDEIAKEFGVSRPAASQMCAAAYKAFRRELFKRLIEKEDLL
jgi:hypothetical protein